MSSTNYDYTAELEYNITDKVYNLFITTFNGVISYDKISFYLCDRQDGGRLDKISSKIYSTSKWTGTLGMLNDIMNPHSVREGDIILYLPESEMDGLKNVPDYIKQSGDIISSAKNDLINSLKKKVPNADRTNFNSNRKDTDTLPPTVLPSNAPEIVVENNKILISPNTFNNPNTAVSETIDELETSSDLSPKATNEEYERVLINSYIKKLS